MYIVCFVDVQPLHMSACMHNPVELRTGQGISPLVAPWAYSLDAGLSQTWKLAVEFRLADQ